MKSLSKTRTGIHGLDEVTFGGIPKGRPTLICGGPGCGKTLFSIEFLVKGATKFNEPGVFITFEEKTEELVMNVSSLGFDLEKLQKEKRIRVDHVHIERSEIEETGEYDLEGLFIRLEHSIDSIGAKRVVLDTIENLFAGLTDQGILRAELRRLFHWLKDKGVTAVVTGEQGKGMLTRHGLEEYVSDCVILLDHRVINQISTRRLRIVKYRGSAHGTNEFPFLIDEEGITVLPVTSLQLNRKVSSERISTGMPSLNEMFGGKGFYRGSSILLSGTAGTGKTSIAAYFVNDACKRNERAIFFAFEESPQQVIRNMKSIGLNLEPYIKKGLLEFHSARPALYGLEMHLSTIYKIVKKIKPATVVLDPVTNLVSVGLINEVNSMLLRLIDFLQGEGITVMLTALMKVMDDRMDEGVSSLVDTWINIKEIESNGERNKVLYIMKSRGMKHSNQVREFIITGKGLELAEIYLGPSGVLLGSEREEQKLQKLTGEALKDQQIRKAIARKRQENGISKQSKQRIGK
ncbi:MAG TPA: circadian clock protein KaiC [Chitinophagaceae bacterium]|nr:circadian clock protein KaiC [Chitinophagaceae bacterium]